MESSSSTKRTRRSRSRSMVDSLCPIELLPADILNAIFQRLNYIDLVRLQAVSSYWNSLVEDHHISPSPWLILPSKQVIDGHDTYFSNNAYSSFLKLGETQLSNLTRIPTVFRECCCVGSSNGWLAFLEDGAILSLFHPFRQVKIQLPSLLGDLLGIKRLEKLVGLERLEKLGVLLGLERFEYRNPFGDYEVEYFPNLRNYITKEEIRFLIYKFMLIREPDHNKNFDVILLCNKCAINARDVILYYKSGIKSWRSTLLNPRNRNIFYYDILWKENHLYVLNQKEVDVFGFEDGFLVKMRNVLTIPRKVFDIETILGSRWANIRYYLIESCGDILLVVRFVVSLKDSLKFESSFKTKLFQVYRLVMKRKKYKLAEMESLGDRVLFVGGNQSVSTLIQSFLACEKNSIYYTDDDWFQLQACKGGQDMGIYNLTNRSVKSILNFSSQRILPPPYWIIPNSEKSTSSNLKFMIKHYHTT